MFARPLQVGGVVAGVLVLVMATAGLAGGLEEVSADDLPTVAPGEVFEGEPWHVRVAGAGLFAEAEPARLEQEGNHWLVLSVEVEVTAPASRIDIEDAIYVTGIDGLGVRTVTRSGAVPGTIAADDLRLVRDSTSVWSLHPGLPEQVLFLWERSGSGPPPTEIEVHIVGLTFRESSISRRLEWLQPEPRARLTVPLQDLREADLDA